MGVRLIATDVDGTLLRTDHTISPRTLSAFAAAKQAGLGVLAISGRQPYSIAAIVSGSPLEGPIIGSNGAVAADTITRELLFEEALDLEAQRAIVRAMLAEFPDARVVSVRNGGNTYVAQHGYVGEQDPGADNALWPVEHRFADLAAVLAKPSIKLVIRDDGVDPETLLAVARELDVPGVLPITSGAPFLEVGRAGVSKASALERYCAQLGVARDEVIAFGDNNNDATMLAWAGRGVAMANATDEALDAADEVALHNDADGIAVVIERLLDL